MTQTEYNIRIIREALDALSSSSVDQLQMNKDGLNHLEDIFDCMPLDFLPLLEKSMTLGTSFFTEFRELYIDIDKTIGNLEWYKQDQFIIEDNETMRGWRTRASALNKQLNELY